MTWAACGKPKWLTVTALRVRSSTRPWPRSRVRSRTGTLVPGQAGAAVQQRGLVGLDGQQVVGLLAGDQELGGVGVGVQRVGGDHRAGQVQVGQQRLEGRGPRPGRRRPGVGRARRGWRGPSRPAGGPAGRRRVGRRAASCRRPRPPVAAGRVAGAVAVGQPRADHRGQRRRVHAAQGPADGGLGRHAPSGRCGGHGGRRARHAPAGGRPRPTRRSR